MGVTRGGDTEVTRGLRLEEKSQVSKGLGEEVLDRNNDLCKGPGAGNSLLRPRERRMAGCSLGGGGGEA